MHKDHAPGALMPVGGSLDLKSPAGPAVPAEPGRAAALVAYTPAFGCRIMAAGRLAPEPDTRVKYSPTGRGLRLSYVCTDVKFFKRRIRAVETVQNEPHSVMGTRGVTPLSANY